VTFSQAVVGNLLAVLSWTLSPRDRHAVRLSSTTTSKRSAGAAGGALHTVNGVMFTIQAGAMITVSATVLGVFFRFRMPELSDTLPTGFGWIAAVVMTGVLFSVVAAKGYRVVAAFANLVAPLMVVMFVVFGVVGFRKWA
jgi:hypothetical protein